MDALPLLCLLGVFCSLALAIDKAVPPEDIEASGDDEDFSGSGNDGLFLDVDSDDVAVVSTLVPTMEGSTAAQEPEIIAKEETKLEDAAMPTETTKTQKPLIEVDAGDKEAITQEATTSPLQQTSTAELPGEIDTIKHHHHPHHPHHHTTTSSTTLPSESEGPDEDIPRDLPVNTTAGTPDEEFGLLPVPHELTTPVDDLAKHGVLHEEDTTSGSTSTYAATEEANVDPLDADKLPALDSLETTTVAEHTHKDHHHHHHHPHHTTTTSSFDESEFQEVTTRPSDTILGEGDVKEERTTTVAEDEHPPHHPHHHHHPTHHHKTTPSTTESTEPEQPHEVHTHEPKGRRVNVPDVRSTTAAPVHNEEHIPDDAEKDVLPSSTARYNVTANPFDEIDDTLDSKEEGPSGVADQDLFFEVTVPALNRGISNAPISDEGTPGYSQGIMDRKELLAGIIAGGVAGLVFAACLVAFVLYRMKKKDEGSYSLEEPKQSNGGYQKPREQREFYA